MDIRFSVLVPLYNKEREIEATLRSILAQRHAPAEIVVVDDGSTDRSAGIVRRIAEETAAQPGAPSIRLIGQPNAGECAARNRAIREARSEWVALVDADDCWHPDFLAEIASMIAEWPDCGLYCTGFNIIDREGSFPAPGPAERGVVDNFFRDSARRYIATSSTSAMPRRVFDEVGGFPEGMKIGGDLYTWIKIARRYRVCFSPRRLVDCSKIASNRSAAIYTPEQTPYSFETLYDPEAPVDEREFIARAALGKALILAAKGDTEAARRAIRTFGFTRTYRRTLRKVQVLIRLPRNWRPTVMACYNYLAWKIARKGL